MIAFLRLWRYPYPADHPDFFSKGTQTGGFDLSQGKPFMNLLQIKLRMKNIYREG
jgi:hypothetical protein